MPIRTILVPVAEETAGRRALAAAIPLAREFGAHITAFHVRYDPTMPMPYVAGPIPADMLVEISASAVKLSNEQAARYKSVVMELFAKEAIPVIDVPSIDPNIKATISGSWKEDSGNIDYRYGAAGRVFDLAVVSSPVKGRSEVTTDVLEGLLFYSGRPVLMVPEGERSILGGTTVIAWNGSREGSRAVSGAIPFLKAAKRIVIVTVGPDGDVTDAPSGQSLAENLKWHGITCEVVVSHKEDLSDGQAILKVAASYGADLLVTGAYSHSRLRELILGGVTHDVVQNATIPVLFGH